MQNLRQQWPLTILRVEDGRRDRPLDGDLRIVPAHADLVVGGVEVGALVLHGGRVAGDAEAVDEAGRHPELAVVLAGEDGAHPTAEGGRARPDVDRDVEDLALQGTDQLALGFPGLRVQAAQDVAVRVGLIVLDEGAGQAFGLELFPVIDLEEEAALVGEDSGLDEDDLGNGERHESQAFAPRPRRSRPYFPACTASHQERLARYQRTVTRRPEAKSCRGSQLSSARILASSMA